MGAEKLDYAFDYEQEEADTIEEAFENYINNPSSGNKQKIYFMFEANRKRLNELKELCKQTEQTYIKNQLEKLL